MSPARLLTAAIVGSLVTAPAPAQVGGSSGIMIGTLIQSQFGKANNWPLGSALSIVTMLTVTALVCLFLWGVGFRRIRGASRT